MKKNLLLLFVLAIAFASCKKEDAIVTPVDTENAQRSVSPAFHFTKKVLVEEFVGCNYANTPCSNYLLNSISAANSNRVYVASMHLNDVMEIGQNLPLANSFSNGNTITVPSAMINRTGNTGSRLINWQQYNGTIQQSLAQSTPCGLAISTRFGKNHIDIDVMTKFNCTISGAYSISAYLVHESINSNATNYGQANAFNSTPNNPFFGAGNPILPYNHQNVVFKMLTATNGGKVNTAAQVIGGIDLQKFGCDITATQVAKDSYVIAFITDMATHEVINTQKVKLGLNKSWD